jgi:hypothetical protein
MSLKLCCDLARKTNYTKHESGCQLGKQIPGSPSPVNLPVETGTHTADHSPLTEELAEVLRDLMQSIGYRRDMTDTNEAYPDQLAAEERANKLLSSMVKREADHSRRAETPPRYTFERDRCGSWLWIFRDNRPFIKFMKGTEGEVRKVADFLNGGGLEWRAKTPECAWCGAHGHRSNCPQAAPQEAGV